MITTDPLPELMRDFAASVRRAADQQAEEVRPEDFAALVRHCRYALLETRRAHRATETVLKDVVEVGAFRRRCESELAFLDEALAAAGRVRRLADRVPATKQRDAALTSLGGVEKGLAGVRRAYDEYIEALNRPMPPTDPKKVEESYADFEAGNYESVQDIWARIQAGLEEP